MNKITCKRKIKQLKRWTFNHPIFTTFLISLICLIEAKLFHFLIVLNIEKKYDSSIVDIVLRVHWFFIVIIYSLVLSYLIYPSKGK